MRSVKASVVLTGLLCGLPPLSAAVPAPAPQNEAVAGVEGAWLGTLKTGAVQLRILFKIFPRPDGTLQASLVSLDQGRQEVAADAITVEGDSVSIRFNLIRGAFDGRWNRAADLIDGVWKQSGLSLPLQLRRSQEQAAARRPQEPVEPFPYRAEEVSFQSGNEGRITIAGSLTIPVGDGPYPAVVLISGSGPQDRDESVFGHRPFLVLADHLTRHGIAVLRTDDRGVGGSTGGADATSAELAEDIRAGIDFLRKRPGIDPKRVGLIGHSEGGMIAPMVAADSEDVAFIVLMAAPGLTGEEILYRQGELLAGSQGADEAALASYRAFQERIFKAVKDGSDEAALAERVRAAITDWLNAAGDGAAISEAFVQSQTRMVTSRWFRFMLTYDPLPALRQVRCPVLAVTGEKDLQVPPKENLAAIRRALTEAGHPNFKIMELEGLNHLFQHAQSGAISEYAGIEETLAPKALSLITDWIHEVAP